MTTVRWTDWRNRSRRRAGLSQLTRATAERDVEFLLWSAQLATVRRFFRQPHWEAETARAEEAQRIEGETRSESVAEHSWKVADAVLALASRFPGLDRSRAVELAVLHDKLELITGDYSPIDRDATGLATHAFNLDLAREKQRAELVALQDYCRRAGSALAEDQAPLFLDLIEGRSNEALFVKAVDKLVSLTYVIQVKRGRMAPAHVAFTLAYTAKAVEAFPGLAHHHDALVEVFMRDVTNDEHRTEAYAGPSIPHRTLRSVG